MSVIPPLLEDKRTSRGEPISVAIDPRQTWSFLSICGMVLKYLVEARLCRFFVES